jgi:molybdopterin synthase catalytic subunit
MDLNSFLIEGPVPAMYLSDLTNREQEKTASGALAFFLGKVRNDMVDGKMVTGIEYSAYYEMVEPVIQSIKDELFNKYPDLSQVHIMHSTGLVKCGENSLAVMIASGHRKQSFAALAECVELIKEKLPIWKKELFSDGTTRWIG